MSTQAEMPVIIAMAEDFTLYRHAMSLHADKMMHSPEAVAMLKLFDPSTGEFDALGIPESYRQTYLQYAATGEAWTQWRLEQAISRLRLDHQTARLTKALDADCPNEQLSQVSACVTDLAQLTVDAEDDLDAALADIDRIANGKMPYGVIGWPLAMLRPFGMLHKHELIIIGGRPGSGKSALMGQVAYEFSRQQQRVLYISLEMGKMELRHRWTAYECGFSINRLQLRPDAHAQYKYQFQAVTNSANLVLRERYGIGAILSEIATQAASGLSAVFIDYLQLIQGNGKVSRLEQLSDITRCLKLAAKQLQVPIFAGSQLNRASEHHERPGLSSLRESGSIEQDADRVILLHRDDEAGHTEVIQAKLRNGPCKVITAKFSGETTSFSPAVSV